MANKEPVKLTSRQLAEAAAQMADPVPQITGGEFKGEAIPEVAAPRRTVGLVPQVPVTAADVNPRNQLAPTPAARPPSQLPRAQNHKEQFIVIIRSDRGTLHPALDEKHHGKGALATYDTAELAESACQGNEICKKLQYYILGVA